MKNRSLKVCHITESFLPKVGGMQVVVDGLAAAQAARGHRVTVVCPRYPGLTGPDPAPGYTVARCFGSNTFTFALGVALWLRLAVAERFDVIHAHNAWPGGTLGAMAAKLTGAALVITSHGRDIAVEPDIGYGSRLNPMVAYVIRRTLKSVDSHTVLRESMVKTAVDAGSDSGKVSVVPNFIPAGFLAPKNLENTRRWDPLEARFVACSAADEAFRRVSGPYLLSLGRLHPVKGLDKAIAAFKTLKETAPGLKLVIAGQGSAEVGLRGSVAKLGLEDSVEFAGQVTGGGKVALLRDALALLVTSKIEAFPVTLLEAMALGTPVLAPRLEAFRDLIDGDNGIFIDPDEPGSIADAVSVLSDEVKYKRFSAAARETAERFSVDLVVGLYEDVYAAILTGAPKVDRTPAEVR